MCSGETIPADDNYPINLKLVVLCIKKRKLNFTCTDHIDKNTTERERVKDKARKREREEERDRKREIKREREKERKNGQRQKVKYLVCLLFLISIEVLNGWNQFRMFTHPSNEKEEK